MTIIILHLIKRYFAKKNTKAVYVSPKHYEEIISWKRCRI